MLIKSRKAKMSQRGVYVQDKELKETTFTPGSHFKYVVDPKNRSMVILPSTDGNTVSKRNFKDSIKPVIDIRNKDALRAFEACEYLQIEIHDDQIVVKGYSEEKSIFQSVKQKVRQFLGQKKVCDIQEFLSVKQKHEVVLSRRQLAEAVGQYSLFDFLETDELQDSHVSSSLHEALKNAHIPLEVVSLFSGAGIMDLGFKQEGFNIVHAVELDADACTTYQANLGNHIVCADMTKYDLSSIPKAPIMIGGSPCFEPGTLIMTSKGYVPIEQIRADDSVLTHTNQFKRVVGLMVRTCSNLLELKIMGAESFRVTEEHPFYVREMKRVYSYKKKNRERRWLDPEWIEAKNLTKNHFIGIAINQESKLPDWNGVESLINQSTYSRKCNLDFSNPDLWWIIGRYIGDGWTTLHKRKDRKNSYIYRTVICCAKKEADYLKQQVGKYFNYTFVDERTAVKLQISHEELFSYLQQFGKGASFKRLTSDILNLPIPLLQSFLGGYLSSDGSFNSSKGLYKISTTSKELAYGIAACIHKVFKVHCTVYKNIMPKKIVIEGREVNQKDFYGVQFRPDSNKRQQSIYEDGYLWVPFREKKLVEYNDLVFNMEVEDDNSYTVYNFIVHNCQGFSNSNRKTNFLDNPNNQLVRSFIEAIHANDNCQVFVLENVPQILTAGEGQFRNEIYEALSDFKITSGLLNAADYSTPQSRKRAIFIGSKIGKIELPQPIFDTPRTVREALEGLHDGIPNQLDVTTPKPETLERMKYIPQGGNWRYFPEHLRSNKERQHNNFYRLEWDRPAITIPNPRKNNILHPEKNAVLTVREAARLADVPDDFVFHGKLGNRQQQIANCVPVRLARALANVIKNAVIQFNIRIGGHYH
jgi:site-specific DNA-cytosine methylase